MEESAATRLSRSGHVSRRRRRRTASG